MDGTDGNTYTVQKKLTVDLLVEASFGFNTNGLDANFSDGSVSSEGDVQMWEWDFGDGQSATVDATASSYTDGNEHVIHSYEEAGTYTATLTVTNTEGHTHSTQKKVSVSP
jgi:PKD repeat protein